MKTQTDLKHVYEVYIRTTPQKLWQALTDGKTSKDYFYGGTLKSDWKVGSSMDLVDEDEGRTMLVNRILEIDPPRKLVHTFSAQQDEEHKKDRPSRVTWFIEPLGDVVKLTVTHDDFDGETVTYHGVKSGWGPVLSGLKTILETGKALNIPMPD
jgi:uncharacterized protein YndB with AHSA1/START domain